MTSERQIFADSKNRYIWAPQDSDLLNALYQYNDNVVNKAPIMRDLCEALKYDSYIPQLDALFQLPKSYRTPIETYQQTFKTRLGEITDLMEEGWQRVFQWSKLEHLRSVRGSNYFQLQKFKDALKNVVLFESDVKHLLKELDSRQWVLCNTSMAFLRLQLGHMPYYFTEDVKREYRSCLLNSVRKI